MFHCKSSLLLRSSNFEWRFVITLKLSHKRLMWYYVSAFILVHTYLIQSFVYSWQRVDQGEGWHNVWINSTRHIHILHQINIEIHMKFTVCFSLPHPTVHSLHITSFFPIFFFPFKSTLTVKHMIMKTLTVYHLIVIIVFYT